MNDIGIKRRLFHVMAGLVPAIHVFTVTHKTWMPVTRPGMTEG